MDGFAQGETKAPTLKDQLSKLDRDARRAQIDAEERGNDKLSNHMMRAVNALGRALKELG